jgi:hypothetical protein
MIEMRKFNRRLILVLRTAVQVYWLRHAQSERRA